MSVDDSKHIKEAILNIAVSDGYVTPVRVSKALGLDGKAASKYIHELEVEGKLDETWMRLYTPKDQKQILQID